ncbi:WD40 repeat-like protein [Rhizoclosmatium globosum]|uniref:WD40 repeat-like protein n=1 Tax=Rhizoclosmatium globosum TaxID=329046 RepID=A0A1Y2BFG5_9FUNG|nr:WD40 repeat-like protein [Rhizoclosmatium globosum]|eukprot:ORY33558.1 WD40 repeat-like protein [Rhizoclosmatium globosum]
MLEFALKTERKRYQDLQLQLASNNTPSSAPNGSVVAPQSTTNNIQDSLDALAAQNPVAASNWANNPPSAVPLTSTATALPVSSAVAATGAVLSYSKGLGQTRSREILKNYLREANYLLAHSAMPALSTPHPSLVPGVSTVPPTTTTTGIRQQSTVGNLIDDEEADREEEEENELRFRARGATSLTPQPQTQLQQHQHQNSNHHQPSQQFSILKKATSQNTSSMGTGKRKQPPNRNESNEGTSISDENDSPRIWKPKASLTSHLDSVRAVAFIPNTSRKSLLSCSEDGTTKLWALDSLPSSSTNQDFRKTITPKSDTEPIVTFRGHAGPVTSLVVSRDGSLFYTGGTDSSIRVWNLKDGNGANLVDRDTYSSYGKNPQRQLIVSHTDTVWDMQLSDGITQTSPCLATASADGTGCRHRLLATLRDGFGGEFDLNPTSIAWMPANGGRLISVVYQNALGRIFDVETGKVVLDIDSMASYDGSLNTQINKIIAHPTLPLLITAHEDRFIRFFDVNTGSCIHSMLGHQNAVTSLSVPPSSGLTFASSGHDCSIRWWDIGTRSCVQEYSTHRQKNDEGIWDVAYHPTDAECLASGGADGIVKLFELK